MHTGEDTVTGGRMVTRELAEWVAALRFDDLPDAVAEEAARSFTDFLGECLFVGATKPWGRSIAEFCERQGGAQREATIIASGAKTLSSRAAVGQRNHGTRIRVRRLRRREPGLSVRGHRAARSGRSRAAARAGSSSWPSSSGTR